MTWTYTDATQKVVWKDLGNGMQASCLASALIPSDLASVQPYVPPAPQAPRLPFLDFMALFTPSEQSAIVNSTDTPLKIWLLMATGTGEIDLGDPKTISGVAYLVSLGLITAPRHLQILAGTTPA